MVVVLVGPFVMEWKANITIHDCIGTNVNKQLFNCNKHIQTLLAFIDVTNILKTDNVGVLFAVLWYTFKVSK